MEYGKLDPVTVIFMRLEEARRLERKPIVHRCDLPDAAPIGDGGIAEVTVTLTLSAD